MNLYENIKNNLNEGEKKLSYAESRLLSLIQIAKHFDNLEGITLDVTPKGNFSVYHNGKRFLTISSADFGDNAVEDLRAKGYFRPMEDEDYNECDKTTK